MLELIVSIAIIGIIASFVVPSFENSINRSHVNKKSEEIFEYIRLAKIEAVKRNKSVEIYFDKSNHGSFCLGMRGIGDNINCSTTSSTYPSLKFDKNRHYEIKTSNKKGDVIDISEGGLFSFNPYTGKSSNSKKLLLKSKLTPSVISGVRITDIGFIYACSEQKQDGKSTCV
nr:hypothetical protein [Photobacterium rosenbergii]